VKVTIATLLDYAELGDTALRVYITAHARIEETGCQDMTVAALLNLPGLPRNPKALARAIQELASSGLVFGDEDTGRYCFPIPERGLSSKRAAAGRLGGLAKASKRLASATAPPLANGVAMPEGLPAVQASNATDPPSPPAPPLPVRERSGSEFSESSSLLSSGSRPESKPAREGKSDRRWRFVPKDWTVKDAHRQLAKQLRLNVEHQELLFREHEFADPKSDADKAFSRWLRRASDFMPPGANSARPLPPNPRTAAADAEVDRQQQRDLAMERARLERTKALFGGGT